MIEQRGLPASAEEAREDRHGHEVGRAGGDLCEAWLRRPPKRSSLTRDRVTRVRHSRRLAVDLPFDLRPMRAPNYARRSRIEPSAASFPCGAAGGSHTLHVRVSRTEATGEPPSREGASHRLPSSCSSGTRSPATPQPQRNPELKWKNRRRHCPRLNNVQTLIASQIDVVDELKIPRSGSGHLKTLMIQRTRNRGACNYSVCCSPRCGCMDGRLFAGDRDFCHRSGKIGAPLVMMKTAGTLAKGESAAIGQRCTSISTRAHGTSGATSPVTAN